MVIIYINNESDNQSTSFKHHCKLFNCINFIDFTGFKRQTFVYIIGGLSISRHIDKKCYHYCTIRGLCFIFFYNMWSVTFTYNKLPHTILRKTSQYLKHPLSMIFETGVVLLFKLAVKHFELYFLIFYANHNVLCLQFYNI